MSNDVTEEEIWRQLFALADRCQPIVTKHTVCILSLQKSLKVAGTGVLLRVADKHFLLSAAHVMDSTFYHGMQFYTSTNTTPLPPIPLLFVRRDSSARRKDLPKEDPDLRDHDPLDFSIAELQQETAEKLSERYRFLQVGDLDPSPLKKAAGVLVFGYPSALTKPGQDDIELESFPLPYVTTPLQVDPERRDKDKDILLYYPEQSSDGKGGGAETPEPFGFSGCGIWRISQPPLLPGRTQIADIRLVGIQHRWRRQSRYLVGTSVSHILDLLWLSYPELHRALRLIRSV